MKKFDKDKYLKNLNFKRNLTKYGKYFYIGVPCVLAVVAGIYFAYSKFTVSKDAEVVKTTVGEFIHGDVVIGAYIDGVYSSTIPGKTDGYIVKSVSCDNGATGTWNDDKWGLTLTNMTKRTKCNIYFETKKLSMAETINNAASNTSMIATDDADHNVRYIGANPSNYVYFNCSDYNNQSDSTCEKWKIIGVFNNVTKSDGSKENLVKIIRDESVGNYSWDSSDSSVNSGYGVNDWTDADAMKLLNPGYDSVSVGGSLYYNAKSGTCYNGSKNATTSCDFTSTGLKNDTTRNAIETVVWNLGGTASYTSASNGLASHFYGYERGTTVYSGRPTTWTGKVGLMYPSDYGYATGGSSSTSRATCLAKELYNWDSLGDCYNNDYLFNSAYQWTLAPGSGGAYRVFYVTSVGYVGYDYANLYSGVRPALYLKSNISVDSGTGESSNPYRLKF